MAEPIAIKITNLPQIRAAFSRSPYLMRRELNLAIRKSVFTIQAQSVRNTPVKTGRLRGSTSSTFGDLRGEVGTHTNYDIFVHYGTRYMKARPYLKEAIESENDTVQGYFNTAVNNVLSAIGRAT